MLGWELTIDCPIIPRPCLLPVDKYKEREREYQVRIAIYKNLLAIMLVDSRF